MNSCHTLIIGAGISGLSYAAFSNRDDYLIIEAESEVGGYCRTVIQDGFVWDYSGHFFHFRHPEIERYLVDRMPADQVKTIAKRSDILFKGERIDFPFQKNIHQLPKEDFIDCLYDLYFREDLGSANFRDMLYSKFGAGICERFLIPYNEKLYACDLSDLDADAMGRFFPYADVDDIIRNFRKADNASYNATFTYPEGGAIEYVKALQSGVNNANLRLNTRVQRIDLDAKVAHTTDGPIQYQELVSSAPFDRLMSMTGTEVPAGLLSSNKVLVFNLGFDRKGWEDVHWVYFPERKYRFYRVGFYDNIFGTDRMSIYVEIGMKTGDAVDVDLELSKVLQGLEAAGVTSGHQLVSKHHVVLDPAYVHITTASQAFVAEQFGRLAQAGVHSIGRYGGWKYCAIEDNIVEARELLTKLQGDLKPLA
ncbi:MAG: FAD-dependent oxidoreductase [Myxococcales bacterium]|nr:FAD-dependent oxidoreductase [Myxococcales bacterium]